MKRPRSSRNRSLTLTDNEQAQYRKQLLSLANPVEADDVLDRILHQDILAAAPLLPRQFVDLMIIDPPYNLTKQFNKVVFERRSDDVYQQWAEQWLLVVLPLLKPTASVYVCADWRTSPLLYPLLRQHLIVRNRITWEREKGRGAKSNWKNAAEDIWFATVGNTYTFDVDRVKLRRRVRAPYRNRDGDPKDWAHDKRGKRFRLTHPSNLWTDISVPFWSMPENTDHPTQKPEKLIAKLVLASSNEGDVVFAPFAGAGTTPVVARKLKRQFVGVEQDERYCCYGLKRLERALDNSRIQGYTDGVFWERNSRGGD